MISHPEQEPSHTIEGLNFSMDNGTRLEPKEELEQKRLEDFVLRGVDRAIKESDDHHN